MQENTCCASMSETLSRAFQITFCCRHEWIKRIFAVLVWLPPPQNLTAPLNKCVLVPAQGGNFCDLKENELSDLRLDSRHPSSSLECEITTWRQGLVQGFGCLTQYPTHCTPQADAYEECARNTLYVANRGKLCLKQSQAGLSHWNRGFRDFPKF